MITSLADCYRNAGFQVTESEGYLLVGFKPEVIHAVVKEVWNEHPLGRSEAEAYYGELSAIGKRYGEPYFRVVAHGGFLSEALDFEK